MPTTAPPSPEQRRRRQEREREARRRRRERDRQERLILLLLRLTQVPPRIHQRLQEELIRVGEWRPQIRAIASRWAMDGVSPEEFESAGLLGLLTAASRYDVSLGHRGWPTYATLWIRVEVARLARHSGPLVLETEREIKVARKVARALRQGASSLEAVAEKTGLSPAVVVGAMEGRRPGAWCELDNVVSHPAPQLDEVEELDRGDIVRAWLADLRERYG